MHDDGPDACERVAPTLVHYVRGEVHPDEIHAIADHLGQCVTCRNRLTLERALSRRLREMRHVDVPVRLKRRVRWFLRDDREPSQVDT